MSRLSRMCFEVLVDLVMSGEKKRHWLASGTTCAHRAAMARAILDSGASSSFVPPEVVLGNARPGKGHVSVANGQREPIVEEGDLGPLRGVQKVKSFHRVLISVAQLCQQFGVVLFSRRGAQIVTEVDKGEMIITQIGLATQGNLYSFDLLALEEHVLKVKEAGGYDD